MTVAVLPLSLNSIDHSPSAFVSPVPGVMVMSIRFGWLLKVTFPLLPFAVMLTMLNPETRKPMVPAAPPTGEVIFTCKLEPE